jgi:hypothetical protein
MSCSVTDDKEMPLKVTPASCLAFGVWTGSGSVVVRASDLCIYDESIVRFIELDGCISLPTYFALSSRSFAGFVFLAWRGRKQSDFV